MAGFTVERSGAELTYTPEITWKNEISDEEKTQPWYIESASDERIKYTATICGQSVNLFPKKSTAGGWVLLESTPTCGLLVDAEPDTLVRVEICADVPLGKRQTLHKHTLMRGQFGCPERHAIMSSPGYTIMDADTNKLLLFLSVADVGGVIKIVSVALHCNIESGLWVDL